MFKHIKKLAPLTLSISAISISMTMTACSVNNKPVAKKSNVITTQKSAVKKSSAVAKKQTANKFNRVSYEKRSPKRTAKNNNRRNTAQRVRNYGSGAAASPFLNKLSGAALNRLKSRVRYDGSYVKIGYPWGDVPQNIGVCTDVVIRSYRKLGIDLQQQVHQDMSASFNNYPNLRKWGLKQPDTNIDHRRVVNLRQFFARRGAALPMTRNPADYKPGDLVTWMVGPNLPHIGIVVDRPSKADPRRKMIVHNIANGPQIEDVLFRFPMTGHYRYTPSNMGNIPRSSYTKNSPNKSRGNQMSYAQLLEASKRLGSSAPNRVAAKPQVRQAARSIPLTLATLSESDKRLLLGR